MTNQDIRQGKWFKKLFTDVNLTHNLTRFTNVGGEKIEVECQNNEINKTKQTTSLSCLIKQLFCQLSDHSVLNRPQLCFQLVQSKNEMAIFSPCMSFHYFSKGNSLPHQPIKLLSHIPVLLVKIQSGLTILIANGWFAFSGVASVLLFQKSSENDGLIPSLLPSGGCW